MVLLPAPVYPTIASVRPAGITSEMSFSAALSAPWWRNVIWRNSIAPVIDVIP